VIIYAHTLTARLQYIADFIGKEINGNHFFHLTDDVEVYRGSQDLRINYSGEKIMADELLMMPHRLLFETGIRQQPIDCFEINGYKAFFRGLGDYPFDIFAASFYLLTRYEEYLPHKKDEYGRYAHENSLAYRDNFLHLPLINLWIRDFKRVLQDRFPTLHDEFRNGNQNQRFRFLPTYDIDEAWSFKHKSFCKTAGGVARSFFKGGWQQITERIGVLTGKQKDPYDAYQWMDQLHQRFNLQPRYFFIMADKNSRYDKNILPGKKAMGELIRQLTTKYSVGLHPSWQSGDDVSLIRKEKEMLEKITGEKILSSRQHYIRLTLPETFRFLIEAGIENDYSMGYGSINGFRASVTSAFFWYDLEKEITTQLRLFPFCFMDANSFYEQKISAQEAYEEMNRYSEIIKTVNGTMISIWHNSFLGNSPIYRGWKEAYEKFISGISS